MGPWSGGKSTMINYFLGNEFNNKAFRSGAEPSEGFNFNIAMYGDAEEDLEGTELAAEFTFSSLQKFGQEFLKKLRGKKMPNKLLKKVNKLSWFCVAFTYSFQFTPILFLFLPFLNFYPPKKWFDCLLFLCLHCLLFLLSQIFPPHFFFVVTINHINIQKFKSNQVDFQILPAL